MDPERVGRNVVRADMPACGLYLDSTVPARERARGGEGVAARAPPKAARTSLQLCGFRAGSLQHCPSKH